ncbi:MAG: hypothetical protein ABI647_19445 [Gemmatimonadota bacterium]
MDRQTIGVMIPLTCVFFGGLLVLSRTIIGQAIARRIGGDASPDVAIRLNQLEQEIEGLHAELAQAHERIDFAERMLARTQEGRPVLESRIPTPV